MSLYNSKDELKNLRLIRTIMDQIIPDRVWYGLDKGAKKAPMRIAAYADSSRANIQRAFQLCEANLSRRLVDTRPLGKQQKAVLAQLKRYKRTMFDRATGSDSEEVRTLSAGAYAHLVFAQQALAAARDVDIGTDHFGASSRRLAAFARSRSKGFEADATHALLVRGFATNVLHRAEQARTYHPLTCR